MFFSKIKALLRRSYNLGDEKRNQTIISVGAVSLDTSIRTVTRKTSGGKMKTTLSGKEYEIFHYLISHPKVVVSKEELFNAVWGEDCFSEMSTMTVYIRWLREKLEEDSKILSL